MSKDNTGSAGRGAGGKQPSGKPAKPGAATAQGNLGKSAGGAGKGAPKGGARKG